MSHICEQLHLLCTRLRLHRFPYDESQIPKDGIYLLFEDGETAHGTRRIVRIGTHTGTSQLRARLRQHFVKETKDRSIFRKNIGRALLTRANDSFIQQWEWDLTSRKGKSLHGRSVDSDKLHATERAVSDYIQAHLTFVVFRLDGKGPRLSIERKLISTVSLCTQCTPSLSWLGLQSPVPKIRTSGLWLVNELYGNELTSREFRTLSETMTG